MKIIRGSGCRRWRRAAGRREHRDGPGGRDRPMRPCRELHALLLALVAGHGTASGRARERDHREGPIMAGRHMGRVHLGSPRSAPAGCRRRAGTRCCLALGQDLHGPAGRGRSPGRCQDQSPAAPDGLDTPQAWAPPLCPAVTAGRTPPGQGLMRAQEGLYSCFIRFYTPMGIRHPESVKLPPAEWPDGHQTLPRARRSSR